MQLRTSQGDEDYSVNIEETPNMCRVDDGKISRNLVCIKSFPLKYTKPQIILFYETITLLLFRIKSKEMENLLEKARN